MYLWIEVIFLVCLISSSNIVNANIFKQEIEEMPVSEYIRPYNISKTNEIFHAVNGSSYIDPNNEVVQWYVLNTNLTTTGLYYLNGEQVLPIYQPDDNYINKDYWMNADYYLSHNLIGDCEDYAIGIASILEAKSVPNMIVAVRNDTDNYYHTYLQYYYEGEYYSACTMSNFYTLRINDENEKYEKAWMFNININYTDYCEDWIKYE